MRSAAAAFDDDIGAAPPRRRAPAKPRSPGKGRKKGGLFRTDRLARVAAVGMSAAIGVGILVNALMMQKGHHPAPLFAKAEAAPTAAAPAAPVPEVAAPSVPARAPVAEPPARMARAAPREAPDGADDPIARLLKGGTAAPGADKGDGKTVLGVQKALAKLGFAVKANGTMGAPTRKAIEAFEKDRKLPVKGEISRRLVKLLASESGMRIE